MVLNFDFYGTIISVKILLKAFKNNRKPFFLEKAVSFPDQLFPQRSVQILTNPQKTFWLKKEKSHSYR